jgi:hypothetical protein
MGVFRDSDTSRYPVFMRAGQIQTRVVLAIGLLVCILLAAFWLLTGERGPLSGDFTHDFGAVVLEKLGQPIELKHTFQLTNISEEPVRLMAARPDCGCVNARQGLPATILPGKTFGLGVTMALQASQKDVIIYLEFEDGREQKLRVKARGVPADSNAPPETLPAPPTSAPPESAPADR